MRLKEKKLKELILYICDKCKEHSKFGMVKLNKILFFSDFMAYSKYGKPITGAKYFKNINGPTPRKLLTILRNMEARDELEVEHQQIFDKIRLRPIARKKYKLNLFTENELAIVDNIIKILKYKNAKDVSELSQKFIGYQLVNLNDDIPYYTVFCQEQHQVDLPEKTIKKAIEISKKHGLPINID